MPYLPGPNQLTLIERYACDSALYQCTCGNTKLASPYNVEAGRTRSCGCLNNSRRIAMGKSNLTHGRSHTREFNAWMALQQRCLRSTHPAYKDYGGRGITVCARWTDPDQGFSNFLTDMGIAPADRKSIDRIDNDGNYEPTNCRWADHTTQMRNQRRSRKRV